MFDKSKTAVKEAFTNSVNMPVKQSIALSFVAIVVAIIAVVVAIGKRA